MKRAILLVLLVVLAILELYLLTGFFPAGWQVAINDTLRQLLPHSHDFSDVTHPAMHQEIEQAMREGIGLRLAVWTVLGTILMVKLVLIRRVYRCLGRFPKGQSYFCGSQ